MAKRKIYDKEVPPRNAANAREDNESSDEDVDMLNVDFEWFDPQPAVDFHGLKTLSRQLFDVDAELFNLSELVDLILSQPLLGSTVKVDGNESDPYAFLTVLNLSQHRDNTVIRDLTKYLQKKAGVTLSSLPNLLASSDAQVGLILTERLINMPPEIVPPMYTMLLEEIEWALEEKEPYKFSHYLILSKTYAEVEPKVDQEDERPSKKKRPTANSDEAFYFHPEDEVLHKYAAGYCSFDYTKQGDDGATDSKRAFSEMGISPKGHLILIAAEKFKDAVGAVSDFLRPPN